MLTHCMLYVFPVSPHSIVCGPQVRTQRIRFRVAGVVVGHTLVASSDVDKDTFIAEMGIEPRSGGVHQCRSWCANMAEPYGLAAQQFTPPTPSRCGVLANSSAPASKAHNCRLVYSSAYAGEFMKLKTRRRVQRGQPLLLPYGRGSSGWGYVPGKRVDSSGLATPALRAKRQRRTTGGRFV